jgi:PAS domain S-box-containing protein
MVLALEGSGAMIPAQPTFDEAKRLEALRRYAVLDTLPEQPLDDLTTLAAQICEAPIALITLVDEHRQWFKARVGLETTETPRDTSFCAHAIHERDTFIVPNATQDERFVDNPFVTGEPYIRFYAGVPLVSPENTALGTLCVIDRVSRTLTPAQLQALRMLARQVMTHLELHRQTNELVASEERLRIVTDNARVGLVIVSQDRRYLYANHAYAEILGLPTSAIVGQRVPDVLPKIYDEQIRPRLDRAFAGERVTYELHKPVAGGDCHYAVKYEPTIVNGAVTMVVVVITDITALKQAEIAPLRLASIVESSDDAIIGKDLNGIITSWNRGAGKIFGYTANEMVGTSIMRLIPEDRWDEEEQILGKIRAGESVEHFETLRLTKGGRLIDISVTASPIMDATGKPIGVSKVARDITERKQAERALRKSEGQFRVLVEQAADAFFLHDAHGKFLEVNRRACKSLGYSKEELLTMSVSDISDMSEEAEKSIWNQLQAGLTPTVNDHHRRKDGSRFPVELRIGSFDADGEKLFLGLARDITDRVRSQNALLEREEQLRLFVEHSPAAIAMLDLDMKYLVVSRRWMEGFRLDDRSIIGRSHYEVFPEVPQHWIDIHRRCLAGAVEKCEEEPFRRVDGRTDWIRWEIRPWRQADGLIGGIIIFTEDITERKRAAQQLTLLNTCVANLNDIVLVTEADPFDEPGPRIVFVNEAFERITGYTSAETLGQSPRFLQGEKTDRRVLAEIREALARKQPIRRQILNYGKDGAEYWLDMDIVPILDAAGKCTHFAAIERDITQRKQAEEQIAEQAALLDKARDAILVRDLKGKILFWNKGAEHMYGWTRQEAVGRNVSEIFYADPKKFEKVNGLTIGRGEWSGELQHLTKDRRELTIEARWTLIRDNEGTPKSVLAINTDITEKKKIEAQFMRAQRMESIGTLAGGVAHDLNNILAPIMMSIDILKTLSDQPQAMTILETIEVSAKRGADIVRQVLSFARGLEGQRIEVQPKHLLKDLENIIKDTFPKDIRLQFSIPNNIWTILGDPTQVHQILLNLCVNARDAMPNGGDLTIGVENCVLDEQYAAMNIQAKPGRYVTISVTDSGTGMPSELLDKIFEPFFTTKALNKGTGLGLSTVMAIVKSHDGIVNVYSEPGKGTTFKVYLPALETSLEARKEQTEVASLPRGNGETILVIDDEASILTITSQTLQAFGYRVVTAMDGADALSVYVQHRNEIAVVLTDMMMPILDGPATIHALIRINPAVKIVAASGLNTNGGVAKASGAGIKHFLTKPYTAGTLLKTMRAILEEG